MLERILGAALLLCILGIIGLAAVHITAPETLTTVASTTAGALAMAWQKSGKDGSDAGNGSATGGSAGA